MPDETTSATTAGGRVPEGFPSVTVRVVAADGTVREWCVLLAATGRDRGRGLMEVDGLGQYRGMVFDFLEAMQGEFYMLKTRIPLSIAFFGEDGRFVSSTDMAPCPDDDDDPPCPRYGADAPYRWGVEAPEGGLGALGMGPGSRLEVTDSVC